MDSAEKSRKNQLERNPHIEVSQGHALVSISLKSTIMRLERKLDQAEKAYDRAFNAGDDVKANRQKRRVDMFSRRLSEAHHSLLSLYGRVKKETGHADISELFAICGEGEDDQA